MVYMAEPNEKELSQKNLQMKDLSSKINSESKIKSSKSKKAGEFISKYWWTPLPFIPLLIAMYHCTNRPSTSELNKTGNDNSNNLHKISGTEGIDEINGKAHLTNELLANYLKSPVVLESVKDIVLSISGIKDLQHDGRYKKDVLSSSRNFNSRNANTTNLEKDLDKLVDNGLSHLKYTTMSQVNQLIGENKDKLEGKPARFYDCKGVDGSDFYKYEESDDSMAIVCSQYNALESVYDGFSPVKNWYLDGTQGPRMALSALVFAKLRESSYLKGKLNDAINDVLGEKWKNKKLKNGHSLYSNGYLNLDCAYNGGLGLYDQNELIKDIQNNIDKFKLNFQWVLCNDKKTHMIQIFAAAPSIQDDFEWYLSDGAGEKSKFYNPICETIQVYQMRMVGKLAKLRRIMSGKPFALHIWTPGGRSFQNHPYVLKKVAAALIDEVHDVDIDVYFHNRTPGNPGERALEEAMKNGKILGFESAHKLKMKK